jgi:hypothetical protein
MSPARASADRLGSRFFQPVIENRFGMGSGPAVWQQLFQMLIIGMEADKKIADVGPRLNTMTLGAGQDRIQDGRPGTCRFTSQKEPIFSSDGLMAEGPLTDIVVDCQTTVFGIAYLLIC